MATMHYTNRQEWELVPSYIPTSQENIFTGDTAIIEIHLINVGSEAATVTINDRQNTPMAVIPSVTIGPNQDCVWEFSGRFSPGGLTWSSSSANTLVGYVRGR